MYKAVRYVNSPTSGRESCSCDVRLINERWRCCWCWWCDCWSSALCWRQCWSQSVQSTVASLCYSLVFDVMWLELEALIGASTLAYVQTILGLCLTKIVEPHYLPLCNEILAIRSSVWLMVVVNVTPHCTVFICPSVRVSVAFTWRTEEHRNFKSVTSRPGPRQFAKVLKFSSVTIATVVTRV